MRVFEIDGRFIDLDSITMIDALEEEYNVWGFAVHCKLHEKPLWFGDDVDSPRWRKKEDIIVMRDKLLNAWKASS